MASTLAAPAPSKRLEDPLEHLSRSRTAEYEKGDVIYTRRGDQEPVPDLGGKVKITRQAEDGSQSLVDIYHADEFLGKLHSSGLPCARKKHRLLRRRG